MVGVLCFILCVSFINYILVPMAINAPTANIKIISAIREITKPAIAKPLGCLNTPMNEKISPSNQHNHPNTGTHEKINPTNANTNPAVPKPFFFGPSCCTIIVC